MKRPEQAALLTAARTAHALATGQDVPRAELAAAVRTTLAQVAFLYPGKLVEVRVPPFAAVQVGVPGQSGAHTRGTPPNVVETDAPTWLALTTGRLSWAEAMTQRRVAASGTHADLSAHLAVLVQELQNLLTTHD